MPRQWAATDRTRGTIMLIITGASDDLIEIDGDIREEFNALHGRHGDDASLLAFSDGTVLRIRFSRTGVWRIEPVVRGTAGLHIECASEDDEGDRTDRATLNGDVRWVV